MVKVQGCLESLQTIGSGFLLHRKTRHLPPHVGVFAAAVSAQADKLEMNQ